MLKPLSLVLLVFGFFVSLSAVAEQFSFQEPPPEQSLIRPGDEPKQVSSVQHSSAPVVAEKPEAEPEVDNAFYLKPTYVTQEVFNIFKRQVVEVLKDANTKSESLSQEVLDMKIQVQPMGPQIASLKQMITEMATLLSAQSGASHTGMSRWFMVLLIWCVVLTLLVLFILLSNRKKKLFHSELETGGDYDYLSKEDSSPSHLNLAQTYITMNDYERARKSLEFVIMHSKGELKDKAMQLLKQLPKG